MATDMQITWEKKTYDIPEGFTVAEFVDSLASKDPKAATAELIDDGDGKYTLKSVFKPKG
jgi:hypothetical protein